MVACLVSEHCVSDLPSWFVNVLHQWWPPPPFPYPPTTCFASVSDEPSGLRPCLNVCIDFICQSILPCRGTTSGVWGFCLLVVKPLVGGVQDSFLFCLSLDVRRVVIIVPSVTDFFFFYSLPWQQVFFFVHVLFFCLFLKCGSVMLSTALLPMHEP